MTEKVVPKRAYRSPLREQQAARTRQRIIEAAADLFSSRGFGGTTMGDIAREAEVSVESVHAAGAKSTLLLEAFRHGLSGQTQWSSVFDIDGLAPVFDGADADDALRRLSDFLATGHARSARLVQEFRNVSATDPLVAKEWADHIQFRREGYRAGTAFLIRIGVLDEVTEEQMTVLSARVSVVMSSETYVQLTSDWGLDVDRYREWVERHLRHLRSNAPSASTGTRA